jgi:hypothetical protein
MQMWKNLIVGLALALVAPVVLAAQSGGDTSIGTWKLNLAKSAFSSQTPPKSQTRIYTASPTGGMHVVIEEVAADGKSTKTDVAIVYDGKPHPASGNPDFDSAASKRIDAYETTADLIRNGKVIGLLRRLVSQDGKTMTINIKTEKADGSVATALYFYDRQ